MVPSHIARSEYVSLVTHRRDGTEVATPVWIAEDDGQLLVWTREDSGKVKRLRRDDRVTLTPCDVRGRVRRDAEVVHGSAGILEEQTSLRRVRRALARKYGWKFRLADSGGALLRRGRRPHVGIAVTM